MAGAKLAKYVVLLTVIFTFSLWYYNTSSSSTEALVPKKDSLARTGERTALSAVSELHDLLHTTHQLQENDTTRTKQPQQLEAVTTGIYLPADTTTRSMVHVEDDLGMCRVVTKADSERTDIDGGKAQTEVVCCVMATTKTSSPFDIALHCNPSLLADALHSTGMWEDGITHRMTSILQQYKSKGTYSDLFMDIGGNVGYFSLLAASLGYSVFTVEAMRYNTQLIARSVVSNPTFNELVTVLHRALVSPTMLTNGVTSVCLTLPRGNADNGIVNSNADKCASPVKTTTVDDAIGLKSPVAIKMDIEGFEGHAIAGALKLLHSSDAPCYVWFEYVKQAIIKSGAGEFTLLETLANANYELKDIDPKSKTLFVAPWNNVPAAFFGEARNRRSGCDV